MPVKDPTNHMAGLVQVAAPGEWLVAGQPEIPLQETELAAEWLKAYEAWLETKPANTQRAYRRAHQDLLSFTGKPWWNIVSSDIMRWMADLRSRTVDPVVRKGLERCRGRGRAERGLAPGTISQHLAALSSFYSFCSQKYMVYSLDGRERALFSGANPARVVDRPKISPYEKSGYLDVEQLRAFLNAVKRYQARDALQGLRDYALFLAYISTGRRNSEIRTLKWGDLVFAGSRVFYRWENKGKSGKNELPQDAWEALQAFLRAAGRLDEMEADDFIFTPLTDRATRFANVSEATWTRNRPLTAREVGRLVKKYARLAGLEPDGLHVHTLRHSAAMLRAEAGDRAEDISRLLGHSSLEITQIYLHQVEGRRDTSWAKCATLLGL